MKLLQKVNTEYGILQVEQRVESELVEQFELTGEAAQSLALCNVLCLLSQLPAEVLLINSEEATSKITLTPGKPRIVNLVDSNETLIGVQLAKPKHKNLAPVVRVTATHMESDRWQD